MKSLEVPGPFRDLRCQELSSDPPDPPFLALQSRFLGRGCEEALFSEKMGFSVKRGEAIQ